MFCSFTVPSLVSQINPAVTSGNFYLAFFRTVYLCGKLGINVQGSQKSKKASFSSVVVSFLKERMDENKSLHYHLLLLLRARPKAEAARVQLSFAKQEANILKQQAKQLKKKITERSCSSTS